MTFVNFVIPSKLEELLRDSDDYYVRTIIGPKAIPEKLKEARQYMRDEGPEFILENFNVFYSILHHEATLPIDIVFQSYVDLHKGIIALQKSLAFLLEDKASINEELKQKYQNVIKMLTYIYIQTVQLIDQKNVINIKNQGLFKGRKKAVTTNSLFNLDKNNVLLALNNIVQMEISVFWDPPVVEENFINIVAEVCYKFLENPSIKGEKQVKEEVFNLIGTLLKTYSHSTTFTIRIAQMIKNEEHMIQCAADGVKQLVDNFNCKSLISALVRETTDWQTDQQFQDNQGARFCAQFLTAMAAAMPKLMLPEVLYLNQYLGQEPATLRIAILNVIAEVILNVLTNHTLSAEELEYREDFLSILLEHMRDNSAHVRSRVMQNWTRLQEENAIPRHLVNEVLNNVVDYHLHDKAAIVRKSAAHCIITFLSHNTYGSQLSLKFMKAELEANEAALVALKPQVDEAITFRTEEIEREWAKCVPQMKDFILEQLDMSDDEDNEEANEKKLNKSEAETLIRIYLKSGKFKEAIQIWKKFVDDVDVEDEENKENFLEEFLLRLKVIYTKGMDMLELISGVLSEDDLQKLEVLKEKEEYLKEAVEFLTNLDNAIKLMSELLETTCITDMQEAVSFFIAAYQFKIDNANFGITNMLRIMQRNEQDRKDIVIEAFKTICLLSETSNMHDHCVTVVNNLIGFLQFVSYENWNNFELVIAEWVRKGILDNGVIDMLWQFFIKKQPVSDVKSHAAVELLRMSSIGRRTIIARNVKLVTSIAFTERGKSDLAFLGSAVNLLCVVGRDRIDVTASEPPFKISHNDQIWKDLFDILHEKFFTPDEFYYAALINSIDFLFKVCGKPIEICETFLKDLLAKLMDQGEIDRFIYIRLCQLLGIVAVKHLDFLDETVHKELKRRENYLSENKKQGNKKRKSKKTNTNVYKTPNNSTVNSSAMNSSTMSTANEDETVLEGAQAEDEDAEFILRVLEKYTVTNNGLLSQLAPIVVTVCEKPDIYDDVQLQGAATTALIRYMLVSSQFCTKHIQLLFTIFERTKHSEIKESILVHLSDLLTRFPNIIEPWTPKIYARLSDEDVQIRKATFFTLSSLILRDMIRAHSYIHLMVNSLIDEDEELKSMCRTFFMTLAQKENNLYSVLPDIFSHLMESDLADEEIKNIMKFLFNLMDKTKHMENLVDRFCCKFEGTDNLNHQRNIAHCLTLIQYNEKALKKLHENFGKYKHLIHDSEIYASFRNVMQKYNKQQVGKADLRTIVAELEKTINSVFDVNEGTEQMRPPPPPKSTKKRRIAKKPIRKQPESDEDSE